MPIIRRPVLSPLSRQRSPGWDWRPPWRDQRAWPERKRPQEHLSFAKTAPNSVTDAPCLATGKNVRRPLPADRRQGSRQLGTIAPPTRWSSGWDGGTASALTMPSVASWMGWTGRERHDDTRLVKVVRAVIVATCPSRRPYTGLAGSAAWGTTRFTLRAAWKRASTSSQFQVFQTAWKNAVFWFLYWR
jgi:hypothetical protein